LAALVTAVVALGVGVITLLRRINEAIAAGRHTLAGCITACAAGRLALLPELYLVIAARRELDREEVGPDRRIV
jgi:hypothetical protein